MSLANLELVSIADCKITQSGFVTNGAKTFMPEKVNSQKANHCFLHNVCAVRQGVCNTTGNVQHTGRNFMSTVGGLMSTLGGVQYTGGIS